MQVQKTFIQVRLKTFMQVQKTFMQAQKTFMQVQKTFMQVRLFISITCHHIRSDN